MLRIVFGILLLVLTHSSFAQEQELTKEAFSGVYFTALEKSGEIDRRLHSKLETFRNERIRETEEWLYEYAMPGSRRLVYTKTTDTKRSRTEEINVGEDIFCKFDNRAWQRSTTNCLTGFTALKSQATHQVGGIVSSTFSVQSVNLNGVKAKLYKEYTKYKNQSAQNTDGGQLRYFENRFWLDEKNLIVRQEITSGIIGDKQISSQWLDVYVYEPNDIRIEAPAK